MRCASTNGAIVGNIIATIIATHIPRKTGTVMSFGARAPTWPRPDTMSDIEFACRTVDHHATPARPTSQPIVSKVMRVEKIESVSRGRSSDLAACECVIRPVLLVALRNPRLETQNGTR